MMPLLASLRCTFESLVAVSSALRKVLSSCIRQAIDEGGIQVLGLLEPFKSEQLVLFRKWFCAPRESMEQTLPW